MTEESLTETEESEGWADAYGLMSDEAKALIAALEEIKSLAERTDVPAEDMLYEILCQAATALENAPQWADPADLLENEEEGRPELSVGWRRA